MNRRQFFGAPLGLLPLMVAPARPASEETAVVLNVSGVVNIDQEFVDNNLIPMLRAAINERDVTIIAPTSKQAADLKP